MAQPGMRVTVDAAMRARDVSRPWADDGPADRSPAADPATTARSAAPPSRDRGRWRGPAPSNGTGPDSADSADRSDRTDDADGTDRSDRTDGGRRDGGGRDQDDKPQHERRGKAERRRLSKRHARARR
jgi:hypothetical protein